MVVKEFEAKTKNMKKGWSLNFPNVARTQHHPPLHLLPLLKKKNDYLVLLFPIKMLAACVAN